MAAVYIIILKYAIIIIIIIIIKRHYEGFGLIAKCITLHYTAGKRSRYY